MEYDLAGRRTKVSRPGWTAQGTAFNVDGSGYLTSITTTTGSSIQKSHLDGFGRVTKDELPTTAQTVYTSREYDPFGRVTFQSSPYTSGSILGDEYVLDGLGRTTKVIHADDSYSTHVYSGDEETVKDELTKATTYNYVTHGGEGDRKASLRRGCAGLRSRY